MTYHVVVCSSAALINTKKPLSENEKRLHTNASRIASLLISRSYTVLRRSWHRCFVYFSEAGCRGVIGPVPQPLLIRGSLYSVVSVGCTASTGYVGTIVQ